MSYLDTITIGLITTVIGGLIIDEIRERRKRQEPVFEHLAHFVWDVIIAVATALKDFIEERL